MKLNNDSGIKNIIKILKNNGIGVLPTDTIYGLVGSVLSKKAVEKIYKLRRRNLKKPMIILIGSIKDLKIFKIKLKRPTQKILQKIWPGKISVILPCPKKEFSYLHRGKKSLAFRLPKKQSLIKLLEKTGPLVAPSANPENEKPAQTISQVKKYFGDEIDFYLNNGKLNSKPSTLIALKNGRIFIKRKGAKNLTSLLKKLDKK
ncbi:MAG: threonylcarbamoyl-AMP synthase [Candidatus Brennerbacteria bacterium]|nr:threonylcarbamoyl-AMP synthase [Candidatus Brennerbacteria bacterium]